MVLCSLIVVYALAPLKWFAMNWIMVFGMYVFVEPFLKVCVCLLYRKSYSCPGTTYWGMQGCHLIESPGYCVVEVM